MVSGALADQLTGRSDGRRILQRLFDGNVFTVQHGPPGWFGYQPLFRHLLTILLTWKTPGPRWTCRCAPPTGSHLGRRQPPPCHASSVAWQ